MYKADENEVVLELERAFSEVVKQDENNVIRAYCVDESTMIVEKI